MNLQSGGLCEDHLHLEDMARSVYMHSPWQIPYALISSMVNLALEIEPFVCCLTLRFVARVPVVPTFVRGFEATEYVYRKM